MLWEYILLAGIVTLAVVYLWRTLFRKKGCSCESCPSAQRSACTEERPESNARSGTECG